MAPNVRSILKPYCEPCELNIKLLVLSSINVHCVQRHSAQKRTAPNVYGGWAIGLGLFARMLGATLIRMLGLGLGLSFSQGDA